MSQQSELVTKLYLRSIAAALPMAQTSLALFGKLTNLVNSTFSIAVFASLLAVNSSAIAQTTPTANSEAQIPPLDQFCHWVGDNDELITEADKKFGAVYENNEVEEKKQAWRMKLESKLTKRLEIATGKSWVELAVTADQNNWIHICRATNLGLEPVSSDAARKATSADAQLSEEAIALFYIKRLETGDDRFFDKNKYGTARCRSVEQEEYRFVGCILISLWSKSDMDWYVIANKDGNPVISILSAEDRFEGASRIGQIEADKSIRIGKFVEFPVPKAFIAAKQALKAMLY